MTSMNVAEKIRARVKRGLRAWCADNRGVVALIFVFCIPAFVAAAGVAVDLSQAYNVKTRLSNALDKAALAAGSTNGSSEYIQQQVMNFFNANYPSGTLGTPHDVIVSLANGMVDVQASSTVHTVFMGIFGQPTLEVNAETIVKREVSGLELILVMDNTGSMAQTAGGSTSKIDAAKTAANTLFDILYGPSSSVPTLFIGVVPFSQDVNIGTANDSWTTSDSYNWGPTSWMGCVEARESSGRDVTDDPPSDALFPKYYSPCDANYNAWYETEGSELATNGDFSSASGWAQNGWTIGSGVANASMGSNVAANGDFSASSGWSLGSGWTISSGLLSKTTNTNSSSATQTASPALTSGGAYLVTYTITSRTAGSVFATVGGASGSTHSGTGTYSQLVTAGSGSTVGISTTNGFKGSIDNFSALPLAGTLSRSASLTAYQDYLVSYSVTSYSAGSVAAVVGNHSGTAQSGTGDVSEIVRPTSGSTIGLDSNNFVGAVDNFSVKPLSKCGSGPSYYYKSPLDTTTQGPNMYCAQPLQSMTSDKATLQAAVATMAPAGDTMIDLGMAWAWRMLSPRWRGVWQGFMETNNLPEDYDTPSMTKAVILMTDGDNTFANGIYHAYGYLSQGRIGTTSASTATTKLNTLTLSVCSSMKAHDVLIYTLALGSSFTSTSLNMLKSCATGPAYFFNSPTTADLENNFTTIANQLNSLHITH